MHILTMRLDDMVSIGGEIRVAVVEISGQQVRLAIHAPASTTIAAADFVKERPNPFESDPES